MIVEPMGDGYAESILRIISDAAQLQQGERSPGLHASRIIKDIMIGIDPKRFNRGEGEPPLEYVVPGLLFESMLEREAAHFLAKSGKLMRPGEIERDGITCTIDGIDTDLWVVHEYKLTWMSSRGAVGDRKFWHWIVQIKTYCYLMDTLSAMLHALFVNGDYREGRKPQVLSWSLNFTKIELNDNWQMLIMHARSKGWL